MRKIAATSALLAVAVSVSMVACDRSEGTGASTSADVERDLNLASSVQGQRTGVVSPIEQISNGAPSGDNAGKRIGVPTKKRAPSPAPSQSLADVAAAPPDVNSEAAATTSATTAVATVAAENASASVGAPIEAPMVMVLDPIRSTTLSVAALGATDHIDVGPAPNAHRPGLAALRGAWQRWSARAPAVIRGGNTGLDKCEKAMTGGGGILGGTFGGTAVGRAPVGSSTGGIGMHAPDSLPTGMSTAPGSTTVATGANAQHPGR